MYATARHFLLWLALTEYLSALADFDAGSSGSRCADKHRRYQDFNGDVQLRAQGSLEQTMLVLLLRSTTTLFERYSSLFLPFYGAEEKSPSLSIAAFERKGNPIFVCERSIFCLYIYVLHMAVMQTSYRTKLREYTERVLLKIRYSTKIRCFHSKANYKSINSPGKTKSARGA